MSISVRRLSRGSLQVCFWTLGGTEAKRNPTDAGHKVHHSRHGKHTANGSFPLLLFFLYFLYFFFLFGQVLVVVGAPTLILTSFSYCVEIFCFPSKLFSCSTRYTFRNIQESSHSSGCSLSFYLLHYFLMFSRPTRSHPIASDFRKLNQNGL